MYYTLFSAYLLFSNLKKNRTLCFAMNKKKHILSAQVCNRVQYSRASGSKKLNLSTAMLLSKLLLPCSASKFNVLACYSLVQLRLMGISLVLQLLNYH